MTNTQKIKWNIIVNILGGLPFIPGRVRNRIYRLAGMNIGNSGVRSGCKFSGSNIEIKNGAFINHNTFINCDEKVTIGNNVYIAFDVLITTNSHEVGNPTQRAQGTRRLPIAIGDGSWIGARATILPGVSIGEGCIIAAGAVVVKNCEANGLYAGVPAKRIKDLTS